MEIKYEPVFGYQAKLNDQTNELAEVMLWHDFLGPKFVSLKELGEINASGAIPSGSVILAMRRIIKEPKRWTLEDKKAGRSPEVDSIFSYRDETLTCHFIDGDGEIWAHDIDNKIVTPLLRDCQPIETPAEKAQREEDEFVEELASGVSRYDRFISGVSRYDSFINGARAAYRKLKGGE